MNFWTCAKAPITQLLLQVVQVVFGEAATRAARLGCLWWRKADGAGLAAREIGGHVAGFFISAWCRLFRRRGGKNVLAQSSPSSVRACAAAPSSSHTRPFVQGLQVGVLRPQRKEEVWLVVLKLNSAQNTIYDDGQIVALEA